MSIDIYVVIKLKFVLRQWHYGAILSQARLHVEYILQVKSKRNYTIFRQNRVVGNQINSPLKTRCVCVCTIIITGRMMIII